MRRIALWSVRAFVVLLLLLAVLPVYAIATQWFLRWRASRLLADLRHFEVRKSTWEDFRTFQTRWGRWGNYDGVCNPQHCNYRVTLERHFPDSWYDELNGHPGHPRLLRWLGRVGAQDFSLGVAVRVMNGRVVERIADFSVAQTDVIVDEASSLMWRLEQRQLHPNRTAYLTNRNSLFLSLTPQENGAIKDGWFRLRLTCITSRTGCASPLELAPLASADAALAAPGREINCGLPLALAARDATDVIVGKVVGAAVPLHPTGESALVLTITPLQRLKVSGKLYELYETHFMVATQPGQMTPKRFRPGAAVLLLANAFNTEGPSDFYGEGKSLGECSVLEDTASNRAQVEQGVALDFDPQPRWEKP